MDMKSGSLLKMLTMKNKVKKKGKSS